MQEASKDRTDKQGRCSIVLGEKKPDYLRVEVRKKGFVPVRLAWRQLEAGTGIPNQYTLALERGTSIGGIIHDQQGKPIKAASVYLLVPGGNEVERVAIWDHEEKTDADGRWQCDIVPSKLDDVWIRLAHPDYISDEMYGKTPKPPIEKLRDMTGVMVMKKGLSVSGLVLDSNGQPIEGASVAQGSDRHGSHYPSTKTNSDGHFVFKNSKPGEMILTIQASGYSPDLKQITVHQGMQPIEFRLDSRHTIRGRIIDTTGNPVVGAFVAADNWRGHRSLMWRVDTDVEGRFQWDDAPADEVLIDMGKQHYMSVRKYGMSSSEQEYVITMHSELKIRGKVFNAETNDLIPKFKLVPGIDWGDGRAILWEQRRAKTFSQGHYETTFTYPRYAHMIRIEADGYKPGISRPFGSDEGEVVFDFKLEKGMGPTGIVHLPNGKPAAGAEVILCTSSQGTSIRNGRNPRKRDSQFVETKEDGRFSFPAQTDVYAIVVLHNDGYVEVTDKELAESPELTLQSWARVEGKLLIGKDPGTDESVRLGLDRPYDRNAPRIYHDYSTVTDNNGNFAFERVPPGKARISRLIRISERRSLYTHSTSVETRAGETISVTIGGTGRPVTGRINIPDYLNGKFDWQHTDYGLRVNSPENPYRQLGFRFEGDGSFRIDDVPAGDYYLYVHAYEPPVDSRALRGNRIGLLSHHFTVSEMPNGRSDESLDLGILELEVIGKSDFAPSLVGKPLLDLSSMKIDFAPTQAKGTVLVCFFDMEQRPSRNCIMQLSKKVKELKAKDIIILTVQASKVEQAKLDEWAKENNIPFPVGMVQGNEEQTRFAWGVKSLPWLILTDKKHIVRAEGFSISELEEKITTLKEK